MLLPAKLKIQCLNNTEEKITKHKIEKKGRRNDNDDSKSEAKVVLFWPFGKFNRICDFIQYSFVKLIFNVGL